MLARQSILLASVSVALVSTTAVGQDTGSRCVDNALASAMVAYVREVVTGSDDHDIGVRKQGHLAAIPADEVVLVTEPSICLMAANAYSSEAGDTGQSALNRRVTVIQVRDRYVVADPYTPKQDGEWSVWYIFDSHWRRMVTYLS